MKYSDFLFELGVEELPSKEVKSLSNALTENVKLGFSDAKIEHGEIITFGGPRRIGLIVKDVAHFQEMQKISKRGPLVAGSLDSNNLPLPSLQGFLKSCNADINALTTMKTEKGEWWLYEACVAGAYVGDLLFALVTNAITKLPIAKLMTWGSGNYNFSRPVHWALMLFGEQVISGNIFGVTTDKYSYGHRFHHPQAIAINNPRDYAAKLYAGKVIVDFATRRQVIFEQIQNLAAQNNLVAIIPDNLLDEVTAIVEWPQAIFADFLQDFLHIPQEVIIESLQKHQKCFALKDKQGKLAPHFITIANIESKNTLKVKLGNEKVVKARLSDAAFFYKQDTERPLASHALALNKVVFHAKLGSIADKVSRITNLSKYLATYFELDTEIAERAASLAKCDLLTGMVGEFPDLQGVMGSYYAQISGESLQVSEAINEQYLPRFSADNLPSTNYGLILSLADRIDTLVGLFAIGQKPTAVKDPFKLRRHALAVVRLLLKLPKKISLSGLIDNTIDGFAANIISDRKQLNLTLANFILERMLSFYQAQGISSQYFNAVKAQQNDYLDDINLRINALVQYRVLPEAESLSAICKRADNLLTNCGLCLDTQAISSTLFIKPEEIELYQTLLLLQDKIKNYLVTADYYLILQNLVSVKPKLDAFFDNVMVMAEQQDVKLNRLILLKFLQKLLKTVADISLIHDFST